jgi:hypothetical protein
MTQGTPRAAAESRLKHHMKSSHGRVVAIGSLLSVLAVLGGCTGTFTEKNEPTGTPPDNTKPGDGAVKNDEIKTDGGTTATPPGTAVDTTTQQPTPKTNVVELAFEATEDAPQDFVIDLPEAAALRFTITSKPALGTASFTSGNTLHYVPAANKSGMDSLSVTVDRSGETVFLANVHIDIKAVNDVPVLSALKPQTAFMNATQTFAVAATDVDSAASALAFDVSTKPAHGTLTFLAPVVGKPQLAQYVPTPKYYGPDAFAITVHDTSKTTAKPTAVTMNVLAEGPAQLVGTWSRTKCGSTTEHDSYVGKNTFSATTYLATVTVYSSSCATADYSSTERGTYKLGANQALASGGTGVSINQTIATSTLTPLTESIVLLLNKTKHCGRADWKLKTAYNIDACVPKGSMRYSVFKPDFGKTAAQYFPAELGWNAKTSETTRPTRVLPTPFVRQ